jgi:hypothetical protein
MRHEDDLPNQVNPALAAKVREIWDEIDTHNPTFVVHFASNYTEGLAPDFEERLKNALGRYTNFKYEFHTQESIAASLTEADRVAVNGQFKAIHENLFELGGGTIRALIVHAQAIQILRLLCDNPDLRANANSSDLAALKKANLDENAFDDNVRVYLKKRSPVNRNIKATALADDNGKFFYYNNGLTMTCDRFHYPTQQEAPIIEIENVQVVNGGQTLHALFEALQADEKKLKPIQLLCRVYETKDRKLSSLIAERTNSQSPVNTRDIHSIDIEQIKLEKEFEALGIYYERKKNQHEGRPRDKRLDAEKCGQVYLAFYEELPLEAKNRKGLIFGTKYEDIFNENTTAEKILLPIRLFDAIEKQREAKAKGKKLWLQYASYHLLFALKRIAEKRKIVLTLANLSKIEALYPRAVKAVSAARKAAEKIAIEEDEDFADVLLFKQKQAKTLIEQEI